MPQYAVLIYNAVPDDFPPEDLQRPIDTNQTGVAGQEFLSRRIACARRAPRGSSVTLAHE
jgi:hypothetical protein